MAVMTSGNDDKPSSSPTQSPRRQIMYKLVKLHMLTMSNNPTTFTMPNDCTYYTVCSKEMLDYSM
jgi:hypothetical protein